MEIIVSDSPEIEAGQAIAASLYKYKDTPILLMLAGGSALALLPQIDILALDFRVTISVLDERFSTDPTINNFTQIEQTTFFSDAISRGVNVISTKNDSTDTLQSAKVHFATELKKWRKQNPDGIIIATMGIGTDGHIAGIFPGDYANNLASDLWVVGYTVPKEVNPYPDRITVTSNFIIEQLHEVIVFVVGPEKSHILKNLKMTDCNPSETPACLLKRLSNVKIFTNLS